MSFPLLFTPGNMLIECRSPSQFVKNTQASYGVWGLLLRPGSFLLHSLIVLTLKASVGCLS